MKKISSLFISFLIILSASAQEKKKIDHTTYDEWKSVRSVQQSASGAYVAYEVIPLEGDATLFFYDVENNVSKEFARAKSTGFFENEYAVAFLVEPQFDTIRSLKLKDTPKDKLPKDSLFIYFPTLDSVMRIPDVKSFAISQEGTTIAWLQTKDKRPDCPEVKKKKKKKKNACTKPPTSGTTLFVLDIATGSKKEISRVTNYLLSSDGTRIVYTQSHKGEKDTLSLTLLNLRDSSETVLIRQQYGITQVCFDKPGVQLAFLASADTNKAKNYSLYYHSVENTLTGSIVDSMNPLMPDGWNVSEYGRVYFNQDGSKLYFGTNKLVVQDPEDTLLDSEIARVDIWGANDLRIQPQQLIELNSDKRKSFTAVYFIDVKKMVQLGTEKIPDVYINSQSPSDLVLGKNDTPYQREATWEYPWKSDYYLIEQSTGNASQLAVALGFRATLSPSGRYFVYYSGLDSSWYSISTETKERQSISGHINELFATDNNGNPALADEEGFIGWTSAGGDEYVLVSSRTNLWALHPSAPDHAFSLTKSIAVADPHRFEYYRTDYDSIYTKLQDNFVIGVNEITKQETIYTINLLENEKGIEFEINPALTTNHTITLISKAKKSDRIVLRRMSFTEYPDLEKTDMSFSNPVKFSDVNPQQKEYNWGTVELVSWKSFEGRNLRGLLYKPENFDSTKSYPMIVYFYEKYTDDLHVYYSPKPTASIVHPTEYVSNGYIIFIPDIEYLPGYPAKSAYDCIVSGTDYLTRKHPWIDSTRLGLQGQSWGGYQTAQLITMTTKYKAAMAGAPVSNMISAYGGIRWGSGFSRMFQYEKTQSRIGYTIWERPDLYIANSPIFGLPNVRTPLLIMSNDGDGAVPWYQGIELYMGLRRLNQPVWLLNYNDDEHNLTQLANKRDLSIRMRQFFDYYLLGAPIPEWMSSGVPAIQKGENFGFEFENSGN